MPVVKEFKQFAMRGNVVDMAVGIIIGAAFGKIVSSLVADVLLPPVGMVIGGVDFSGLAITLKQASGSIPAVLVNYGTFINTILDFLIVAFAMFLVIQGVNKMIAKDEAAPAPVPSTKDCPECLMAIPLQAKRCGHCTSVLK